MEFVLIPSGEFLMGAGDADREAASKEMTARVDRQTHPRAVPVRIEIRQPESSPSTCAAALPLP
jgi:formylglycine-generating enzyme required for sulfatase activity